MSGEDSLEKAISTHSIILAWRISWTEEPGRLQSTWLQKSPESDSTWWLKNNSNKSLLSFSRILQRHGGREREARAHSNAQLNVFKIVPCHLTLSTEMVASSQNYPFQLLSSLQVLSTSFKSVHFILILHNGEELGSWPSKQKFFLLPPLPYSPQTLTVYFLKGRQTPLGTSVTSYPMTPTSILAPVTHV